MSISRAKGLIWRPRSLMNSRYPLNWRLGNLHIRPSCCRQKNLGHCREFKLDSLVVQAISIPSNSTAFAVFRGFWKTAKSDYSLLHFCMYVCIYVCMYVYMYVCMYICMNVCLSIRPSCLWIRPHGTTRLPLEWFARNLISEHFSKICQENSSFIKTWLK